MMQFIRDMFGRKKKSRGGFASDRLVRGSRVSAHTFFKDTPREKQKPVFDKAMEGVVRDQQDILDRYKRKFERI